MIVLDRSGSMTGASSSGSPIAKMDAAKSAAEMFTELVENGQGHNVGLVSFSTTATSPPDLALTPANAALAAVQAALAGVNASGATAIGDGLLEAHNHLTTQGNNERQAILLLTDGKENRPPCLDGTGNGCNGAGADIATGAFDQTQICAVGFGDASTSLDEIVLRDLAELQGGIFIAGAGELQLKKFFLDCFSDIFAEFLAVDPIEVLPAGKAESSPVIISSALDTKITFVLAWEQGKPPLELKITTPSGAVLDQTDPSIERSAGSSWLFVRVPLPYRGDAIGQWKAQAVRVDPPGRDQSFFIAGMVAGAGQLSPTNLRFNHYTGQPLWPVVRITAPYRPLDEFDKVEAIVTITRPLVGTGNLLAKAGLGDGTTIKGDAVDPRAARLLQLAKRSQGDLVPTVTEKFPLYDDGTHGDRFANNHYWSTQLPSLGKIEGMYRYNFKFIISEGGQTFTREANHSVYVAVNIDPKATKTDIKNIGTTSANFGEGRTGTIITFVPQDSLGNLLGPGRVGSFELSTRGDVRIEGEIKDDGRGSYLATVSWTKKAKEPALALTQDGQPRLIVDLASGTVNSDLEPREHLLLHFTAANTTIDPKPPNTNVQRQVRTTSLAPGDIVDVSIQPSGFDAHYFGLKEDIGDLEYTGSYSAAFNPEGTTFLTEQPNRPFTYKVRIPESAKAGEKFIIRGEYWNNPDALGGFKSLIRRKTEETVLTVVGKETPDVKPPVTEEAPKVESTPPAAAEPTPVPLIDIVQEQVRGLCGGSPSGSVFGGQIGLLMLPLALGLTGAWRRGRHRKNSPQKRGDWE